MSGAAEISLWLRRWGALHGGGLLELSTAGTCSFTIQDMPVQLSLDTGHPWLLLAAILLDEDIAGQAPALRALLAFAHLGERSSRCGVSLAETGRPVLWLWLPTGDLDETRLANTLGGFAATAAAARQALQSAGLASPTPPQESMPSAMPLGMIRA